MAKALTTLLKQIAQLQKQADALRSREKTEVVDRIKEAIAHYGITTDELFGGAPAKATRKRAAKPAGKTAGKARKPAAKKVGGVAKYTDGAGRTWSGVGKRPNWFKDAIAAGKTAEDLLVSR
jgi:DNA-binding protein H-NS